MKLADLKVDDEFKNLIQPLTADELEQLEKNIVEDGEVREPIVTWNGVIIDGHNRYAILQKHPEISYKINEVVFFSRNEALVWIINNQLGRRNLNKADAILLAQRKKEITAQEAKEKQAEAGKKNIEAYHGISSVKNDKTNEPPINTRKEVARLAGVSEGTVAQFEQVQKKKPELVDKIRHGEMTIGGAYKEVKQANSSKVDSINDLMSSDDDNHAQQSLSAQEHLKNLYRAAQMYELLGQPEPESNDEGCEGFLREADSIAAAILFFHNTYNIPLGEIVIKKKIDCFGKNRYSTRKNRRIKRSREN